MNRTNDRRRITGYMPRLYGYARSLSGDGPDAHDLVQETALKALRAATVPRDEPAYRAWLFVILRNAWQDQLRRRKRRMEVEEPGDNFERIGGATWSHDHSLISTLTVRLSLDQLEAQHREILGLIDVSGFSYAEAAEILDIPLGTVMSRIARARARLLRQIEAGNVRNFPVERRRHSLVE